MRNLSLAAFAALFLNNVAFAATPVTAEPCAVPCVEPPPVAPKCPVPAAPKKPAAKKPAPAPQPEPAPAPPPPVVQYITNNSTVVYQQPVERSPFHLGAFVEGGGGLLPVQGGVVSKRDTMILGGEANLGAYVLYAQDVENAPYFGAHAKVGLGTVDARLYEGGIEGGILLSRGRAGGGLQLDVLDRDIDVHQNTWAGRYIGADFGVQAQFRLDDLESLRPSEFAIVPSVVVGYGQFAGDPQIYFPLTAAIQFRVGLGGHGTPTPEPVTTTSNEQK